MKVNGFKLQQDIREAQEERNLLQARFTPALHAFPGDDRTDVATLVRDIEAQEERIARLQEAQVRFNLLTTVQVGGATITLALAIKRLGGYERVVNLWRTACSDNRETRMRYGHDPLTRDADEIVAERTISVTAADELRRQARARATALRAAIQKGNATEVDAHEVGYPTN